MINCVQLWIYKDYDFDCILISLQFVGGNFISVNEQYCLVMCMVIEDVLQLSVGVDVVIWLGGVMCICSDDLCNYYGSIVVGGDLDIIGLIGVVKVENLVVMLYCMYQFFNVSYIFGGDVMIWSVLVIFEVIGKIGGSIVSGGLLNIDVGDLSNFNQGWNVLNVQNGLVMVNFNVQGFKVLLDGLGYGGVQGLGQFVGIGVECVLVQVVDGVSIQ